MLCADSKEGHDTDDTAHAVHFRQRAPSRAMLRMGTASHPRVPNQATRQRAIFLCCMACKIGSVAPFGLSGTSHRPPDWRLLRGFA
eukprot:173080-Chlamydomonas_euryale.AAC.4